MEHDRTKEEIKKDLLKNIDKMVDDIYKSLNNAICITNLENVSFVIEGNPYKQLSDSDVLVGKHTCPVPSEKMSEPYLEVLTDVISKNIKLSEEVFTHHYNFTYKNGMELKDLPAEIINILEIYEMNIVFQETNNPNAKSTQKWLLGIGLLGNLRYQNKMNSPYLTNKEIKSIIRGFIRNLKSIYNILNGRYLMIDDKNKGITLFDCLNNPEKEVEIEKT
jgi:hypothetical protein